MSYCLTAIWKTHPKIKNCLPRDRAMKKVKSLENKRKHEPCVSDGRNHLGGYRKGHQEGESGFPSDHQ